MYYYLSIGTNLNPYVNAVNMVKALSTSFGNTLVFPFIVTQPEGMDSNNEFVNSVLVVSSELDRVRFKEKTNEIEEMLGRDRSVSDRATLDRPADIDILCTSYAAITYDALLSGTSYVDDVITANKRNVYANLSAYGLPSIQGPTTVNFNRTAGNIVIVDNELDCFNHSVETAL